MTAQPEHAPTPPSAPGPATAAELLARLRTHPRASTWVPAFEQAWAAALEDSRHSYSLTRCIDLVRAWQARLAAAPAVQAFIASGRDDSGGIALDDIFGPRR
ncbi:DUF6247 family protein [Streptomyces sp. NPDC051776]|uniref:DUF6247 family protein n=1 Tax=Streptomyces sp. NPDC051776 TaxID=3155414 RepID=UPI00341BDD30